VTLHLGEGRRTKATPERIAFLLAALEAGDTRTAAAASVGVHIHTLSRWLVENEQLRDAVEVAESRAEHNYLGVIAKAAADGNWQPAAWWLERRKWRDYAKRERVDVTIEMRHEMERLAEQYGVDAGAALAEAERILAEAK
jgi:transposase-like protein